MISTTLAAALVALGCFALVLILADFLVVMLDDEAERGEDTDEEET